MKPVLTDESFFDIIENQRPRKPLDGQLAVNAKPYNPSGYHLSRFLDPSLFLIPVPKDRRKARKISI